MRQAIMPREFIIATLMAGTLLTQAGCLSLIKQGVQEVRGAQAELRWVSAMPSGSFDRFRSVELEPSTTTAAPICTPRLLDAYNEALTALARELERVYPGGEPRLRVSSELQFFQGKGLLSGGMCIARVRMHDGGQQVGDALIVGETSSFRAGGEGSLAEACVEELGKTLGKRRKEQ